MTVRHVSPAELLGAFTEALKRQLSVETDRAKRLIIAGETKRQMDLVLRLAPYERDATAGIHTRSALSSAFEAAYFSILAEEIQCQQMLNTAEI
jgi:hypothetical protein